VTAANDHAERQELHNRYQRACALALKNGCDAVRQQFEAAVQASAKVVISITFNELERLTKSDTQVFSTFYNRVQAGLQIPKGGKWDVLRGIAEHALFPGYKDQVRFGALSLDETGVKNYGECSIVLKDLMVGHRTSLFEGNNVVFTVYKQKLSMADAENLDKGFRAVWPEREKLCIAKLVSRLHVGVAGKDFPSLLLEQGATTMEDEFVEAHVWGSLTVRSMQHVRIHRKGSRPRKAVINDVGQLLSNFKVPMDIS